MPSVQVFHHKAKAAQSLGQVDRVLQVKVVSPAQELFVPLLLQENNQVSSGRAGLPNKTSRTLFVKNGQFETNFLVAFASESDFLIVPHARADRHIQYRRLFCSFSAQAHFTFVFFGHSLSWNEHINNFWNCQ